MRIAKKPVFAVLLTVFTGCGLDSHEQLPTDLESGEVYGPAAESTFLPATMNIVAPPRIVEREETLTVARAATATAKSNLQAPESELDGLLDVSVTGTFTAPAGTTAGLAVLLPSCGYYLAGKAVAPISSNQLSLTVPDVVEGQQSYAKVVVFVDNDGDGLCNTEAGDSLFEGDLPESGSLSLELSTLTPSEGGWFCYYFNGYGE